VEPIPQSNIVAVTAQGATPEEAQDLANAFSEAAVEARTAEIRENVAEVLPRLESQLNRLPDGGDAAESLASTISELRFLSAGTDPTIALESPAELPGEPSRPRPALSIAMGLFGGLAAGLLAAFALQFLDPVLRREAQLRGLLRVPVLARVPNETGRDDKPLLPTSLAIQSREAYRTLRATLAVAGSGVGAPKSTLVTGPGAAEGKSTTALNLAISLALAGSRVLLIESDLRRPSIGSVLGVEPERGVVSVLIEQTELEDAIVTTKAFGPNLKLLLADHTGPGVPELLSLPAAQRLLRRAEELADYVIIDSPPLTDVIDALPLARQVDAVLLVVRLGKSRLSRIKRLGELLSANDIKPIGFTVLGTNSDGRESDYHYYSETTERSDRNTAIARYSGTGS
jgi:capsular exopolysaccharide synthesis family protein